MSENQRKRSHYFVSLRWRLLIAFTVIFLGALVAGFFWFSDFATNLALKELKDNIVQAAETTAADLNGIPAVENHLTFEREDMDTEPYNDINLILRRGKWNNPRASGTYTMRPNLDDPNNAVTYVVSATVVDESQKTIRDLAVEDRTFDICQFDPDSRIPLGVVFSDEDFPRIFIDTSLEGFEETAVTEEIYTDSFGTWLTAVAPFYDAEGNFAGAVGVDACAEDIVEIEENIRNTLLVAFGGAFLLMSLLVSFVSYGITRPIKVLTDAAEKVGQGDYDQDFDDMADVRFGDEVTTLAGVFDFMVEKVRQREEKLKEKVASLEIIIDRQKRDEEVAQITESDYFQELRDKATALREGRASISGTAKTDTSDEEADEKSEDNPQDE